MAPRRASASSGPTAWRLASRLKPTHLRMATADEVAALGVSSHEFELEVAWDGHPVLVAKAGQDVRVFADDLREWSAPAQNVALTVRDLPADELVLEGRLCVLDAHGRPDFALLKERASKGTGPAPVLMVSDVLVHDGQDLSGAPRTTRRERLPPSGAPLVRSEVLEGSLDEVLAKVRQLGLPGVIAYRRGGPREALAISATPTPLPLKRSLSMPPRVTNADKVLYPNDGITKQHVLDWYREIAPVFLPHLRDRPVVSQRWPDGIDEFTWFQHRPPPRAPDYLDAVAIDGDRRLLVQNTDALLWMVNQAALTFHTWSSRVGSLMNPDWAVVDLDPGTRTTWPQVIEVATAVRRLLELLEVPSVVKTSGQKGLHVLVPLAPGQTLEQAHRFSLGVCSMVAQLLPEAVSLSHDEKERRGRLFLDHLQNFRGKTLVAPYSLRAVDRAPVSTPLRWDEVTPSLDPRAFTRAVVLDRLAQFGDLFAPVLTRGVQLEGALAKLAGR